MNSPEEFFRTGLQTYLDAKTAVSMFEREVQLRVKKAVVKHQHDLAASVGDAFSLKDFLDSSMMPQNMYLGQQALFRGVGGMYFYVDFSRDATGPSAVPAVSFWRDSVAALTSLWEALRGIQKHSPNANLGIKNSNFYLTRDRRCDDWAACETVFDEVINEWANLWRTLGGLPKSRAS